eukprot:15345549-Ditylum_brightwellii.AAC.1
MTCYSMWGKLCPLTKGFGDGYPALMGMSQSLGGNDCPLHRGEEGLKQRKEIETWWGGSTIQDSKKRNWKIVGSKPMRGVQATHYSCMPGTDIQQ